MSMQDNDMDQLFRSRLEGMEVEPSERVWKGITVELDGAKPRRSLMPIIRIAASVLVLLSAGLFFVIKNADHVRQQASALPARLHAASIQNEESTDMAQPAGPAAQALQAVTAVNEPKELAPVNHHRETAPGSTLRETTGTGKQEIEQNPRMSSEQSPLIADATPVRQEPVSTQAEAAKAEDNQPTVTAQQMIADNNPVPQVNKENTANENKESTTDEPVKTVRIPAHRHGIKSFGDLINVVVAKVDKRPDKLIEFSDTDGDEATITGINLGVVKVKREK